MTTDTHEHIAATAQIVDACMKLQVPYRIAPSGIRPIVPMVGMVYGPAVPVRHYGSVDIFLEALETAPINGILVIDNGGRQDEACIGDLVVLETQMAGLQGIVVWGLHRDTADIAKLNFPVFSYGAYPAGPARLEAKQIDALASAHFGPYTVTKSDTAFVDQDGVVFVANTHVDTVLYEAKIIHEREYKQAEQARGGVTLRDQFKFKYYLAHRDQAENYTFRKHLSAIEKSIEE